MFPDPYVTVSRLSSSEKPSSKLLTGVGLPFPGRAGAELRGQRDQWVMGNRQAPGRFLPRLLELELRFASCLQRNRFDAPGSPRAPSLGCERHMARASSPPPRPPPTVALLWLFISGQGRVGCVPGWGSAEKGCLDMRHGGAVGREMPLLPACL